MFNMSVSVRPFGTLPSGAAVSLYTMTNASGASVSMTDYGAIVTAIRVPDRNGVLGDVCLGFDNLEKYAGPHGSMGDTIGRYGNSIGKGLLTIGGTTYQLALNDHGVNHLHGGNEGFNRKFWEVTVTEEADRDTLAFHTISPDGDENYPGTLDVTVCYSWDRDNNLIIRYQATTDADTVVNMTNHAYFNLAGHNSGSIRGHRVTIDADVITDVDAELIPRGSYMPVLGTPLQMDGSFTLGEGLDRMESCPQMLPAHGYDHNFVLRKGLAVGRAASVTEESTGRRMDVITDQPAVQLYTACTTHLEGGKDGAVYEPYCGFCLETQHCPDSPNNPQFPGTTLLRPGETYDTTTIYAFRTF